MDVDSLIAGYRGRVRILRLVHIAGRTTTDKAFSDACIHKALDLLSAETYDADLYRKLCAKVGNPPSSAVKADTMQAQGEALTEKLEAEVRAYKNNLIKESIRLGQQDLAAHLEKCGQLDAAVKLLGRNRDYCTTDLQTFSTTLHMTKLSILLNNWVQVGNHVAKLQTIGPIDSDANGAGSASGGMQQQHPPTTTHTSFTDPQVRTNIVALANALSDLGVAQYEQASERLSSLTNKLGDAMNEVMTMHDVADLNCLLTLATSTRPQLLALLESPSYKPYLELDIDAREAMWAFHRGDYRDCFRLLAPVWERLLRDPFCEPHVDKLKPMLRKRALARYCGAFKRIPLARMAAALDYADVESLVAELEATIAAHDGGRLLPGWKIDLRNEVLVHTGIDLDSIGGGGGATIGGAGAGSKLLGQSQQQQHAIDRTAAAFKEEVERTLFRLQSKRAGLEPARPFGQTGAGRTNDGNVADVNADYDAGEGNDDADAEADPRGAAGDAMRGIERPTRSAQYA